MKLAVFVSFIILFSFTFALAQDSDFVDGSDTQCSTNEQCDPGFQCVDGLCQSEVPGSGPVSGSKCASGFELKNNACVKTEITEPADLGCKVLDENSVEFASNVYTSDSGQYGIFYSCLEGNLVKETRSEPVVVQRPTQDNITYPEAVVIDYDDSYDEQPSLFVLLSEISKSGLSAFLPDVYSNGLILATASSLNTLDGMLYNRGNSPVVGGQRYTIDDFPDFPHDLMVNYNTPNNANIVNWNCVNSDEQHDRSLIRKILIGWNIDLFLGYPQKDVTNLDIGNLGIPLTDTEIRTPGYVEYTWWYRTPEMKASQPPIKKTAVLGDECLLSYELSNGELDITNQVTTNDLAIKSAVCADNVVYNGVSFNNLPAYAVFDCRDVIPKKPAVVRWIPGNGGEGYCKRKTDLVPTSDSDGVFTGMHASAMAYCMRTTDQPSSPSGQSSQKGKIPIESCQDSDSTIYPYDSYDPSYFEQGYTTVNNDPNTARYDWCTDASFLGDDKKRGGWLDMPRNGQSDRGSGGFIVERFCKENISKIFPPKECPDGCRQGACI